MEKKINRQLCSQCGLANCNNNPCVVFGKDNSPQDKIMKEIKDNPVTKEDVDSWVKDNSSQDKEKLRRVDSGLSDPPVNTLKTLKDLVRNCRFPGDPHILPDDLKQEAIRWIKHFSNNLEFNEARTVIWIEKFFNITSEDLE